MRRLDPLLGWLLRAALALPLSLALWWWLLREPSTDLVAHGVGLLSAWIWPETVLGVGRQGHLGLLIALAPPLTEPPRLFMALPVPFTRALVVFPLFWGLTLATPGRGVARRLLMGTALLVPVALAMALLAAQFQLVLYRTHLPLLTEVPPADFALALPDGSLGRALWGLGRQLALLVLPVAAPLALWLGLQGAFLRRVILGGWLRGATRVHPATDAPDSAP